MSTVPTEAATTTPGIVLRLGYAVGLLVCIAVGYGDIATTWFLADDFNVLNIIAQAETLRDGTAIDSGWEYFRPLTACSFWLNYRWFGVETATSFHLFALLVHWVNACLVARLTWRLSGGALSGPGSRRLLAAGFAGAAFAVLPVHAECITWIAARADVLCATGVLLLFTGWVDFLRRDRTVWALAEAALGLGFALLSKDSAMILPLLCGVLALVYRGRRATAVLAALVGVAGLFALYLLGRVAALGGAIGAQSTDASHHFRIDIGNAIEFTVDAMRAMLLPGWSGIQTGLCLVLVVYMALRHRALVHFVQIAWPMLLGFLILLAPVANVVQLDLSDGTNTRFLYMPSMFFCAGLGLLLGTGLADSWSPVSVGRRVQALVFAAALLVVVYVVTLRRVNQPWAAAAAMTRGVVTQLQEFARGRDYRWLFIHDLPDTHQGAYVFRNGIDTAVTMFVSEALVFPPHGYIDLATWEERAAQRRKDPTAHPEILLLRWDRVTHRLIAP